MDESSNQLESSKVSQDASEDSSDLSLSDGWTVLDSNLLNEGVDESDAESVEVIANDSFGFTEKIEIDSFYQDDCFPEADSDRDETMSCIDTEDNSQNVAAEDSHVHSARPIVPSSVGTEDKKVLLYYVLDISILLVTLNLILILVLLFTSKAPFIFGRYDFPGSSESVSSRNLVGDESFNADPLSLQLSHVLSKWKKSLEEEHIISHQVLKTILSFFAEDSELESELRNLGKKVEEFDGIVAHAAGYLGTDNESYKRMVTLKHLAYSAFDILGPKHTRGYIPLNILSSLNISSSSSGHFGPEPGFWLNDWHSASRLELNETFNPSIQNRKASSPINDLYLHLGSAQWNSYFWEIYLKDSVTYKKSEVEKSGKPIDLRVADSNDAKESLASSSDEKSFSQLHTEPKNIESNNTSTMSAGNLEEEIEIMKYSDYARRHISLERENKPAMLKGQRKSKRAKSAGKKIKNNETKKKKSSKKKETKPKMVDVKIDAKDSFNKNKKISNDINVKNKSVEFERLAEDEDSSLKEDIEERLNLQFETRNKVIPTQFSKKRKLRRGRIRSSEDDSDWYSRMARGREKLRALNVAEEDLIWIFRRAKARRKLREVYPF